MPAVLLGGELPARAGHLCPWHLKARHRAGLAAIGQDQGRAGDGCSPIGAARRGWSGPRHLGDRGCQLTVGLNQQATVQGGRDIKGPAARLQFGGSRIAAARWATRASPTTDQGGVAGAWRSASSGLLSSTTNPRRAADWRSSEQVTQPLPVSWASSPASLRQASCSSW